MLPRTLAIKALGKSPEVKAPEGVVLANQNGLNKPIGRDKSLALDGILQAEARISGFRGRVETWARSDGCFHALCTSVEDRMTTDEDFEMWQQALDKAKLEATHPSEIEIRALVYYREMKKRNDAASSEEKK